MRSARCVTALVATLLLGVASSTLSCDGGEERGAVDYVIIAGDALSASAQRYKAFREGSGYNVELALLGELAAASASASDKLAAISSLIKELYEARDPGRPFYVLLLGDANAIVPTGTYVETYDGSKNTTDNLFADMNGDHLPELAVGRIPAASDAEVDRIRQKIESYESSYKVGLWNRRLNMFASTASFGSAVDMMIEMLALEVVDSLSYDYDITLTYGSQDSEFVYIPEKFSDKVYERLNEGALVVAYIGHGAKGSLDTLDWNGKSYSILDEKQLVSKLKVKSKPPILFLIACWTGAFDDNDALAEKILRMDDAPPAVIASTEISHPYTNAILVRELGVVATEHLAPTVGLLLDKAKARLMSQKDEMRDLIDAAANIMVKPEEKKALKRTHLYMYTLFGDPGMRLQYITKKATFPDAPAQARRGGKLDLTAAFDNLSSGTARFTLEVQRRTMLGSIKTVPADGDSTRDAVIRSNYESANNKVVDTKVVSFSGGKASVSLSIPTSLDIDDHYVKVYADDGTRDAMGNVRFKVVK